MAMQNIQKTQDLDKMSEAGGAGKAGKTDGPSFQDVMKSQGPEAPDKIQQAQGVDKTQQVDQAQDIKPADELNPSQKLDDFVKGCFGDQQKIEEMMNRCVNGESLDQQELLQLQGLIYGYGQKVELASKVVDKATGGMKQVMNTQV